MFCTQGIRAVPLAVGREDAIRMGKRYVHNDICFPAQIVIGEVLAALQSGQYDLDNTAVAMAKYIGDCRLTHYSALLRKALSHGIMAIHAKRESNNLKTAFIVVFP